MGEKFEQFLSQRSRFILNYKIKYLMKDFLKLAKRLNELNILFSASQSSDVARGNFGVIKPSEYK